MLNVNTIVKCQMFLLNNFEKKIYAILHSHSAGLSCRSMTPTLNFKLACDSLYVFFKSNKLIKIIFFTQSVCNEIYE